MHHSTLAINELFGGRVPMNGQIPLAGGRPVELDGRPGVIFRQSPEAEAFTRWQAGRFLDVERGFARDWRAALGALDLEAVGSSLRKIGIDGSVVKTPEHARDFARNAFTGSDRPFDRITLVFQYLGVPRYLHRDILERWGSAGRPSLADYAPYAAHVATVELFFHLALAAKLIGSAQSSNRTDIAYLHYLPFCNMTVSSDRLHERCMPLFLRSDQEFVWGPELKRDLGRINEHFSALPDAEKEQGIMAFAHAPPKVEGSVVRRLRGRFLVSGYDDRPAPNPVRTPDAREKNQELVKHLKEWDRASDRAAHVPDADVEMLRIERRVRKKKGAWWQVPSDLPDDKEE